MIFLNVFWICFAVYITLIWVHTSSDQKIADQTPLANVIATIGDAFFVTHDWLFIEQFMLASMMMPVALNIFVGNS